MTTRATWMAAILVVASAAMGCGWRQQHLDEHFAKSYDEAFTIQHTRAEPATAVAGLDSQEAAIISDAYRASLARKGQKVEEEPMVFIAPPSRERPMQLAPSVPKEK